MAAHSNRSPSPHSSRPINPYPRNSENNSSIRRSFSGNNAFAKPSVLTNPRRLDPITPANSPSDFASIRSVGKEWTAPHLRDCEEKENDEKDYALKASKLQSPAKGSKNFMAPTISAASKFTPSPRKKVLVERNDPVRTSISLSDGKAMFFSAMSNVSEELGHDQNQKTEPFWDSNLVADFENKKPLKKVTFSDIPSDSQHSTESVVTDCDSWIAPLDADPSLPPYDPKTNYLSPRPQFIRYRPNPRVEMLLNREKVVDLDEFEPLENSLMGGMMSEIFSESDEGSDESQKEADSADMVIGVDEEIEAESHVSEPLPVSTTTPANKISRFVQNNEKKPRSLSRMMCFSMIMTLLIAACVTISVTRSPSFDEFFIKDLSCLSDMSNNLYQQSRIAVASARLSFGRLARHVNHVSANSVALVFKLANELGKGKKRAPLQFMNLSGLQENTWNEGHFPSIVATLERVEKDEFEEEMDEYLDEEVLETEMDTFEADEFEEENIEEEMDEYLDEEVLETEMVDTFEENIENGYDVVLATEEISPDSVKLAELEESEYLINSADQSAAELEAATVVALDILETEKSQADTSLDTISSDDTTEESFLARHAVGILSLFAGLLAVAAFIYHYKRSSNNAVQVEPMVRKQTDYTISKCIHQENWVQTAEGDASESYCPSEMSGSFQRSASYSMREANEVQSSGRKGRKYSKRESLASSTGYSTESPSYGSFTTYERIPIKKNVNGDDEIITPVRRSSRIRNHHHVTSP